MNNEKPKLTEEQVMEIWENDGRTFSEFKEKLTELGYMEKPETAFERAERLYEEIIKDFKNMIHYAGDPTFIVDENKFSMMVKLYREAIAELKNDNK